LSEWVGLDKIFSLLKVGLDWTWTFLNIDVVWISLIWTWMPIHSQGDIYAMPKPNDAS